MRPFGRLLSEGGGKRGLGRVWDELRRGEGRGESVGQGR